MRACWSRSKLSCLRLQLHRARNQPGDEEVACLACLQESFLDEGFILDKRIGIGQPQRLENAKILVANTSMDTDKVKIYGARVRVDSMTKVSICASP